MRKFVSLYFYVYIRNHAEGIVMKFGTWIDYGLQWSGNRRPILLYYKENLDFKTDNKSEKFFRKKIFD